MKDIGLLKKFVEKEFLLKNQNFQGIRKKIKFERKKNPKK